MSAEAKTYKLGATAPTLETIRDMLVLDREGIERGIASLERDAAALTVSVNHMRERCNNLDDTLSLINDTITANSNTTVQVTEENN